VLSEIERLGLQDSVRVQGYVPDADLPAIYNLAKALAFPSLYEGFGLPILEAMACGTPVLTSDCSSLPEVAGDAAVLVDPCSQESLSEGLHRILRDAQLREQLRAAGFKRAAQFSWSRAAEETSRLYRSLADRQQP
jgi:glycosyltransferase involved in cell wall biosynthesis